MKWKHAAIALSTGIPRPVPAEGERGGESGRVLFDFSQPSRLSTTPSPSPNNLPFLLLPLKHERLCGRGQSTLIFNNPRGRGRPSDASYPRPFFARQAGEERGENARLSSFVGAMALGDLVKSTLGPKVCLNPSSFACGRHPSCSLCAPIKRRARCLVDSLRARDATRLTHNELLDALFTSRE